MIGAQLSQFQITAKLGQGGMGEVYRARDTKLGREVAIKVLPTSFTSLPESAARFEREAKALATLNHPGIASIYGFDIANGIHFLVMELVEGETLEERLQRGALPLDEALEIGRQIAEALEAAHERGIVHRDLKPANIKITPEGRVKLLDFGLAKAVTEVSSDSALSDSPTILGSVQSTMPGVILGTAAYMSPEQARGKPVDHRSDVWSFGVVFIECLTGRALFTGDSVSDVLASVLKSEIDWKALPEKIPIRLKLLLRKCLARDRMLRLQHIGDARVDLQCALSDPVEKGPRGMSARGAARTRLALCCALAVLGAAVISILLWREQSPPPAPARYVQTRLNAPQPVNTSLGSVLAISPDGKRLVYSISTGGSGANLGLLSLDNAVERERDIPGTIEGYNPFFSPDGQSVGFVTLSELKTIALAGGTPRKIAIVDRNRGASWGVDGTIVFAPAPLSGLRRVSANGGAPEEVTRLQPGEASHRWPQFLPGARHVLFTVLSTNATEKPRTEVVELATGQRRLVREACAAARYAASGHLLFVSDGRLYAAAFNLNTMAIEGRAAAVLDDVAENREQCGQYTVADDGTLAYITGAVTRSKTVAWLDLKGHLTPATRHLGPFQDQFDLSPDAQRVVLQAGDQLHLLDLKRDFVQRFTLGKGKYSTPIWSPDDKWIIFARHRDGAYGLFRKPANGSSEEERLFESGIYWKTPTSFTADAGSVLYWGQSSAAGLDMGICSVEGKTEPAALFATSNNEVSPSVSPDGKWVAFLSDRSSAYEVYVQPLSGKGPAKLISSGSGVASAGRGVAAQWAKTGDRLFYVVGQNIIAVPLQIKDNDVIPGPPQTAVTLPRSVTNVEWRYVSEEKGFLVLIDGAELGLGGASGTRNTVSLAFNWFTELNSLVPVSGKAKP